MPLVAAAVSGVLGTVAAGISILDRLVPYFGLIVSFVIILRVGLGTSVVAFLIARKAAEQQPSKPAPSLVQVWSDRPISRVVGHTLKAGQTWRVEHPIPPDTWVRVNVKASDAVVLSVVPVIFIPFGDGEFDGSPIQHPVEGKRFEHEFMVFVGQKFAFTVTPTEGVPSATFTLELKRTFARRAPKAPPQADKPASDGATPRSGRGA